jgi:DNA-binding MarR family transcriptional regulator
MDCLEIFNALNHAGRELGLPVLTTEFEIIVYLWKHGRASQAELTHVSNRSTTHVYAKLRRLADLGVVGAVHSPSDPRLKEYFLTEETLTALAGCGGEADRTTLSRRPATLHLA